MSAESWKLTLPCTRAEAEAIDAADDLGLDPAPVLMTTEEIVDDAEAWRLDAYFESEPDAATIGRIHALVPSAGGRTALVEPLVAQDWVTLSQAGLEPVRAGRFFVHTATHADDVPAGVRAFRIEAGQAFGTGHHETTAGCLTMLDAIASEGDAFSRVIDLGTGTGLLAFAALDLWPTAQATATDIDPIAITVTAENADVNDVALGDEAGAVWLIVADGTGDPAIAARGPYDLVIANILAGPLIDMAADVAEIAAPGATIVLAGLLSTQADAVESAYVAQGCTAVSRLARGDWTILRLRTR